LNTYVIRGYHWGYNDETFYPCGSYIESVFTNEDDARKAKLKLEKEYWKHIDLGETQQFFDTNDELINAVNEFTMDKLGNKLFTDDERRDVYIPKTLKDQDYEKFLEIAHLEAYKIIKFDNEPKFMAVKLLKDGSYLMEHDECSTALVYEATLLELQKKSNHLFKYQLDEYLSPLKGTLDELSESPGILKSIISKSKCIKFNESKNVIKISAAGADEIFALNEVLKKPIFEIRILSLEEILKIEEELREEFEC
jgi:hypothetical protein